MTFSKRAQGIESRIERSSLGTPEARRLRATVSTTTARTITSRAADRRTTTARKSKKFGG